MSWGLVAVAGATLISGVVGSNAAGRAAESGERSAEAGVAEQRRQFDVTQESLRPSIEAGDLARQQQLALLGLSGTEAQQAAFTGLGDSPGQQFIRKRQERALVRNAAATGGLQGGNVLTALQEQAAGFASQDIQNQFGRLGQVAGQGQSAATATGQFGAQASGNIQQGLQAAGQARQSGILNQNQALQQTVGGLSNVAGQFFARPSATPPPATGATTGGSFANFPLT